VNDSQLIWEAYLKEGHHNRETTIDVPRKHAKAFNDKFGEYVDYHDNLANVITFHVSIPRPAKAVHSAMREFVYGVREENVPAADVKIILQQEHSHRATEPRTSKRKKKKGG